MCNAKGAIMNVKRMRIVIEAGVHYPTGRFDRKTVNADILKRAREAFPGMVYCQTEIAEDRHPVYCEGEACIDNLPPRPKKATPWG